MPLRTSDGDLVGRAAVFADDGDGSATALEGADMGGPLRTADGNLVGRIAIYQVDDGVASPITNIGGTVSEDLHADPPLKVTPDGESARISVEPGTDGQAVVTTGTTVHWGNQTAQAVGAIPLTEKGDANGVATLGADGKVPSSELNITGGFTYRGSWNAATNTPTLADGAGTNGDLFKVSVGGTRDLGSGSVVFDVGDHVVYVAAPDNRWENFGASEAVSSVNGQTGTVVLDKADIGLGNVDNTSDVAKPISAATQAALNPKFTTPGPLIPKVVFGTTLSTNVPGMVGYDQDALGDTLAMRQLGGQVTTATPQADTDAATKAYVDTTTTTAADTKVAKAGDTMTGPLLIDQNAAAIKARLAMKLPGTQNDAPTTFGIPATYLGVGGGEWNANSYRLIGFGYIAAAGNEYPAVVGYQETSTSSNTRGDLVFGVRPNNNNVPPTIALRINSAGQILAEAGAAYVPGSVGALTTKKYVDDSAAAKTDQTAFTAHTASTGAATHLPAGGTTGQVAVKGTGTTVTWQDPPTSAPAGDGDFVAPVHRTGAIINLSQSSPTVQLLDCSSGDMEVTLPTASEGAVAGKRFILKRMNDGLNGIDIMASPGNIDGTSTAGISAQYSLKDIVFDGTDWWIIGAQGP